jgi:2-methylcitrate dehydratase PrpD
LDGLDEIMVAQGIHAADIDAMRLRFPRSGVALIDNNPLRSHCGQYILPIYALEQKVQIDDILHNRRGEPAIAALSDKTQVLGDDDLDPEFPERYTTIIEVDARGTTYSRRVVYAKGCPENPLSGAEIEHKFRSLAGKVLDDARIGEVIETVSGIAAAPTIDPLIALLQPA